MGLSERGVWCINIETSHSRNTPAHPGICDSWHFIHILKTHCMSVSPWDYKTDLNRPL